MATFARASIVQLSVGYLVGSQRCTCTFHYARAGSVADGDPGRLVDAFQAAITPAFLDCLSTEVEEQDYYARCLLPETVNPAYEYGVGAPGTYAGDALAGPLAMIVQLRQSDVNSDGNNRIYVSGVSEGAVENSLLKGAFITTEAAALATALGTPLVDGAAVQWDLVAMQRNDAGVPITHVGHTVTQVLPTRALGTQRRRTTQQRQFHP